MKEIKFSGSFQLWKWFVDENLFYKNNFCHRDLKLQVRPLSLFRTGLKIKY